MTQIVEARPAPGIEDDHEIPDDLFATLPTEAAHSYVPVGAIEFPETAPEEEPEDILATLPELPTLEGLMAQIAALQAALDITRSEAESLKNEMREKADGLRSIAAALDAI